MKTLLLIAAILSAVHLLLWLPTFWQQHKHIAIAALIAEIAAAVIFLYALSSWWSLLLVSISAYKLVNAWRLIRSNMHEDYLRRMTLRTGWFLTICQGLVLASIYFLPNTAGVHSLVYALVTFQVVVAAVLFGSTLRHIKTTKTLQATKAYSDAELPTLSVLVPARNETDDLHACLQALIASNYPKLEIIVLDDCSQNKHTPEIIRSFAHDGVRFIAGTVPDDNWLAKNYAYQQLADAATGEYLLFCGVDLRVSEGALRELITTLLEKNKTMLSIMPQNSRPTELKSYFIQPMRYAWEISLPRRLFNRPPVLSTCWIIKRSVLLSAGNFKATSRSIVPESHFAKFTARQDDYSFLRSNMLISSKPAQEQQATAVRMRYPQTHRRVEIVWLLSLIQLLGVVLPLPFAVLLLSNDMLLAGLASALAAFLGYVVYAQVTAVMYGRPVLWGLFMAPLAALYDVVLLNYSMYRYEFREVHWKERNICLPIMRFDKPSTNA